MVNYILSVTMATIGICSAKIKTTGMKEGIDKVQKFRFWAQKFKKSFSSLQEWEVEVELKTVSYSHKHCVFNVLMAWSTYVCIDWGDWSYGPWDRIPPGYRVHSTFYITQYVFKLLSRLPLCTHVCIFVQSDNQTLCAFYLGVHSSEHICTYFIVVS
jgi:hypothetical protein